jgi:tRNA(Arg) A34 adenosine deaminase TadA
VSFPEFVLQLPRWVDDILPEPDAVYVSHEDRMQLVIALARHNVRSGTGGPFGAGIFDLQTHTLVAPGVNLVVPLNCSVLHAEVVAIIIAQQILGHFDLSEAGSGAYELVTSVEPCAMCLGAVPWSGVRCLVCGARDRDARDIGFDEGSKPVDWQQALQLRGIDTVCDVCRQDAVSVLKEYVQLGGKVYNAGQGKAL